MRKGLIVVLVVLVLAGGGFAAWYELGRSTGLSASDRVLCGAVFAGETQQHDLTLDELRHMLVLDEQADDSRLRSFASALTSGIGQLPTEGTFTLGHEMVDALNGIDSICRS